MLRPLFWDHEFDELRWDDDQDLVIGRILSSGGWGSITWLRTQLGDGALRAWLLRRQGAGLRPQQLRFWQLILKLPRRQVAAWLTAQARTVWDRRRHA